MPLFAALEKVVALINVIPYFGANFMEYTDEGIMLMLELCEEPISSERISTLVEDMAFFVSQPRFLQNSVDNLRRFFGNYSGKDHRWKLFDHTVDIDGDQVSNVVGAAAEGRLSILKLAVKIHPDGPRILFRQDKNGDTPASVARTEDVQKFILSYDPTYQW